MLKQLLLERPEGGFSQGAVEVSTAWASAARRRRGREWRWGTGVADTLNGTYRALVTRKEPRVRQSGGMWRTFDVGDVVALLPFGDNGVAAGASGMGRKVRRADSLPRRKISVASAPTNW